jgi:3-deoxy-D-manno-octulosonate 8-phosphate phosphatase (KDO 8-P phosphatase)
MEEYILNKAQKVKLLLLDVDGVLTDGRIIYDSKGRDLKLFDVHDGMGVHLLHTFGIPTVLITAKGSGAIRPRARDMSVVKIFENVSPKTKVLERILSTYNVREDELCFVADDLVDLGLMKRVGFPIAVFNACPEIKQQASYVTLRQGGRGSVREVAELILKAKGLWSEVIRVYDA